MPQSHEIEHSQPNGDQATESRAVGAEGNPEAVQTDGQTDAQSRADGRRRDNLSAEQRSAIGRKGGEAVSRNREHMADIGRKGGVAVSKDREHMASIGQKGGRS